MPFASSDTFSMNWELASKFYPQVLYLSPATWVVNYFWLFFSISARDTLHVVPVAFYLLDAFVGYAFIAFAERKNMQINLTVDWQLSSSYHKLCDCHIHWSQTNHSTESWWWKLIWINGLFCFFWIQCFRIRLLTFLCLSFSILQKWEWYYYSPPWGWEFCVNFLKELWRWKDWCQHPGVHSTCEETLVI